MKYLSAYLLCQLGGKESPSAKDIKNVLSSVGIESDNDKLNKLISSLEGKVMADVIAEGNSKLASVPSGGGGGGGAAAASGGSAPAAKEEEKPAAEEEESDDDMVFPYHLTLSFFRASDSLIRLYYASIELENSMLLLSTRSMPRATTANLSWSINRLLLDNLS